MAEAKDILDFWFQGINDQAVIDKKAAPFNQWFSKNDRFDQDIRDRFAADWAKAQRNEYQSWEETSPGRLALIILFDQFSRNMFRNTPQMFASDAPALKISLRTVEEEKDDDFALIERTFLYMPFMHAEDLIIQHMSLECFEELVEESKERQSRNTAYYVYTLDYAQRHHGIIERFGRFPHRNAILQRPSTPEELAFLGKPGSSF